MNNTFNVGVFNVSDPESERRKILTWLAPDRIDIQTVRLNNLRKAWAKTDTGRWILPDLFFPWLNGPQTKSLWLRGDGKIVLLSISDHYTDVNCKLVAARVLPGWSILTLVFNARLTRCSSMIIDKIERYLIDREPPSDGQYDAVAFVLFSFDDIVSQDLEFVLRFLLFQLSAYGPVPEEVVNMYKNNHVGPSAESFRSTFFRVLERIQSQHTTASSAYLPSDPTKRVEDHPRSLTFVIDAIDELSSMDFQTEVLQLAEDVQDFSGRYPHFPIRIALCSRQHGGIQELCFRSQRWYITNMSMENIEKDIRAFASSRMENHWSMRKISSEDRFRICEKVVESSRDM